MPLSPDLSTYGIIRIRVQTVNFKDPQSGALPLDSDRLSWNEAGEQTTHKMQNPPRVGRFSQQICALEQTPEGWQGWSKTLSQYDPWPGHRSGKIDEGQEMD